MRVWNYPGWLALSVRCWSGAHFLGGLSAARRLLLGQIQTQGSVKLPVEVLNAAVAAGSALEDVVAPSDHTGIVGALLQPFLGDVHRRAMIEG
jgi:hypothetical protein